MYKFKLSACLVGLVVFVTIGMMGCEGDEGPIGPEGSAGPLGPVGPSGPPADVTCSQCHDDTNLISGKRIQWDESVHGMGEAYVRGGSSSCVGCHSGNGFADMIAAGQAPNEPTAGDPDPTRQDCRACHQIHSTYTMDDFALRTTDPVDFYAVAGSTFDGGNGNLCANCHQPRRVVPAAAGGVISGINSHWGPHHGGQGSMILGVAGAGTTVGTPMSHYTLVEDTCVSCHMGDEDDHTFDPDVDRCQTCHPGAEDFDINGTQTEVAALIDSLGTRLLALGLIDENTEDGHAIVTEAPEAQAVALWNWIYIAHEDKSLGVHNPAYTRALLEESLTLVP